MAGNEIRYNVKVDASGANRALTQFGRAAQSAGEDAAKALDDTASAGDKARAALEAMAQAMDAELREAAAAADALKAALGAADETFDANQIVADLNRMGVSFDEIRADADQFADTLRRVDGIRVQGVNDGLTKTKTALDGVRNNADQSRSVLANMAGNAAQDLGQIGGVAGTLGVGLGQLAEYAVDGNIALSNLAKVAGPLAALSLGLAGINKYLSEQSRIKAWRDEQVEGYAAAVEEVGIGLGAIEEHLGNVADESFEAASGINEFLIGGEDIPNVAAAAGVLGINVAEMSAAIAAGASDAREGEDALAALEAQLQAAGFESGTYGTLLDFVSEQQDAYAQSTKDAAAETKFFASDTQSMIRALSGVRSETRATEDAWARLLELQHTGGILTAEGVALWNQLRTELQLSDPEFAKVFDERYNTFLDEHADKLATVAGVLGDAKAAMEGYADAIREGQQVMAGAEWGATAIEGATTAYDQYLQLVTGDRQRVSDSQEAWDGLGESVETAGDNLLNLQSPQGRAVYDTLDELGATIVPDLAKAFDDSDGDINKFQRSVGVLANQTMRRLQDEFGVSQEEARLMIAELGLLPEQLTTFYELSGDEEAKAKLALLQGSIDALPDDVQTTITQKILLGDYQGALAVVQDYYNRNGATIPVDADVSRAIQALRNLQAVARATNIVLSVAGSRSVQSAGYSPAPTPTAAARGGVTIGAAPIAPVNVHIHTAVVGDRYDVARVVGRAVRGAVRLSGVRK